VTRFRPGGHRAVAPTPVSRNDWPSLELDARRMNDRLPDLPPWFLDQLGLPVESVDSHLKIHAIPDLRHARRTK
jgi:hypothetical protein